MNLCDMCDKKQDIVRFIFTLIQPAGEVVIWVQVGKILKLPKELAMIIVKYTPTEFHRMLNVYTYRYL